MATRGPSQVLLTLRTTRAHSLACRGLHHHDNSKGSQFSLLTLGGSSGVTVPASSFSLLILHHGNWMRVAGCRCGISIHRGFATAGEGWVCSRLRVWENACARERSTRCASGWLVLLPLVRVTRVMVAPARADGTGRGCTLRTAEGCSWKAWNILPWIWGCNHFTEVSSRRSLRNPESTRSQSISVPCSW